MVANLGGQGKRGIIGSRYSIATNVYDILAMFGGLVGEYLRARTHKRLGVSSGL
jgi:hypothetical protein